MSAGLTMVEIALVILIIATLIGGVLSFKEVMRISRLRKVANEVQSYGIAARTFEQKYEALPGDFADASSELTGCAAASDGITPANPNDCRNGNGDGIIGRYCHYAWPTCGQTGSSIPGSDPNGQSIVRTVPEETTQFWKHLYLAGLITGIIDPRYPVSAEPRWGFSHPESGVWDAGYTISGQSAFIGGSVVVNFVPKPEYNLPINASSLELQRAPRTMTVLDAHYIDDKYDNGGPGTGAIWWGPITTDHSGCRKNDFGVQNTWEDVNVNNKNCVFMWTVF